MAGATPSTLTLVDVSSSGVVLSVDADTNDGVNIVTPPPALMQPLQQVYWRVDFRGPTIGDGVSFSEGDVWSFTLEASSQV